MRATPKSRAATPNRRQARRRRQAKRRRLAIELTLLGGALAAAGLLVIPDGSSGASTPGPTTQARAVPSLGESPTPDSSDTAGARVETPNTPNTPNAQDSPSASASSSADPGPVKGKGSFTTATADGDAVGHGNIRRYKVEVEDGIGVDAQAAAKQIHNILSDKRSWTTNGKDGFQLVADGRYDFTIKIASPDTVDAICATGGLNTGGEVNCDVGPQVVVNLKRWNTGSPMFTGSIDDYRALIINHEVGHRIGHGHEGCPGKGKLAPAMMQQIYGLNGCLPNAWPYTADGTYISGPRVP
ncbi:DUF3152 domain-containing protein [Kitasatospora sp. GP82]|uniref:DUF3152 domain-containing protein n=1 Tax=Kitasatospora sp. GP82 TaxID=3035089 RepID=UPI002475700F|nr:DUF3152 domain-containing protein [Kitasatospora sp. GP82]MDH6123689.1 hypothetical protein [Kitasatospora sp. GP82]